MKSILLFNTRAGLIADFAHTKRKQTPALADKTRVDSNSELELISAERGQNTHVPVTFGQRSMIRRLKFSSNLRSFLSLG
jgi:hypothetical protein